jgi:hypothetical protein
MDISAELAALLIAVRRPPPEQRRRPPVRRDVELAGLIGDQHSPGQLRALLTADGSAWVAQRRVYTSSLDLRAADGRTMPFYLVLGMFLYGDQASGLLVRATARSPLVNVSQDGGASWAFVE